MTKALSLAPNHALAHKLLGLVQMSRTARPKALPNASGRWRWIEIWPTLTRAIGLGKNFLGRAAETEAHIQEALRLSPRDICAFQWMHIAGVAKMQLHADAEAVAWLRRASRPTEIILSRISFSPLPWRCSAKLDEARAAAQAGLALDPSFTIRHYRTNAVERQSDLPRRTRTPL